MVIIFCHVRQISPIPLNHPTHSRSLVLYIIYFPPHLKYVTLDLDGHDSRPPERVKTNLKSDNWRLSIILSWTVFIHLSVFRFHE